METWGVVFVGVIAFASVIQGVFLVGLMVSGRRLGRRIDALQSRIDREVTPAIQDFTRLSRAAGEIADLATVQARRIDLLLADTIEKVEETTSLVQQLVVRPLRPLASLVAFLKGVQRGLAVYTELGRERPPGAQRRRGREDEEHLFI
jgi:hypothetical protein